MEPVCFLCQEYETDIGHQTISCPKQFCKKCLQRGHFAMNCKIFCKDFVAKDERLVKIEKKDDITKTENCVELFSCKVETKMENPISLKKGLTKSENQNCEEFSKSEEKALKYCLESMPIKNTKKRKVDSEMVVGKGLPLEEVQQKIIEKVISKLQVKEIELQTYQSIYALIIKNQGKELETLRESKKKLEIELNDEMKGKEIESSKYQSIVVKRFNEVKKYQDQKEFIEKLSKKVEVLSESKKEMEIEFHEKIEKEKTLAKWVKNQIIEKLSNDLKILRETKEKLELDFKKMKLELNNELQGKETEFRKYQNQAEKTLEMKTWASGVQNQTIEQLSKDLKILRENQEKMELD